MDPNRVLETRSWNIYEAVSGNQTRLNLINLTHEDIEVTLGTGDDQQNIKAAWEDAMKDEMESLEAQKAIINSNQREERKEILKAIDVILGPYAEYLASGFGSRGEIPVHNPQLADISSERIASLEAELSTIKKQLELAQIHKDILEVKLSNKKNQFKSTQSLLTEAQTKIQSLTYKLEDRNHPNHDIRTLSVNSRLRFLNQSTRRNDHGKYIAVISLKVIDVSAIDRGLAVIHGGDVRTDAYMIHENIQKKFGDGYRELFLHIYGVIVDMVNQGRCGRYCIGSKNVEIADLRGTMAHCLSFSEFTLDKDADTEFESLRNECDFIYERFLQELGSAAEAQDAFDFDPDVEKCLTKMRDISRRIVNRKKLRLRSH